MQIAQIDVFPQIPATIEEAGAFFVLVFLLVIFFVVAALAYRNQTAKDLVLSQTDAKERNQILALASDAKDLYKKTGEHAKEMAKVRLEVLKLQYVIRDLTQRVHTCEEIKKQNQLLKEQNLALKTEIFRIKKDSETQEPA